VGCKVLLLLVAGKISQHQHLLLKLHTSKLP
jgi:hypothetical protein